MTDDHALVTIFTELVEANGIAGSVAHLAYHLGAIRQIATGARGPREQG